MNLDPTLFSLPGDLRPRRIYFARGSRRDPRHTGRKLKCISHTCYINAPTTLIATRCAKNEMRIHRCKLETIYELTFTEYARVLRKSGFQVHIPGEETP